MSPVFLDMQGTPKGLVWGKLRLNEAGAVVGKGAEVGSFPFLIPVNRGDDCLPIPCLLSPIALLPEWENEDLFG